MEEAMAVGHDSPPKPALRFYLIGWGIPLIVVVCCETVENALKYL
jgi:hypothetical protein